MSAAADAAAVISQDGDKQQTRLEIVRSFLDVERSYVMLLGCLVEVVLMIIIHSCLYLILMYYVISLRLSFSFL